MEYFEHVAHAFPENIHIDERDVGEMLLFLGTFRISEELPAWINLTEIVNCQSSYVKLRGSELAELAGGSKLEKSLPVFFKPMPHFVVTFGDTVNLHLDQKMLCVKLNAVPEAVNDRIN